MDPTLDHILRLFSEPSGSLQPLKGTLIDLGLCAVLACVLLYLGAFSKELALMAPVAFVLVALYARYREQGDSFVPAYLDMLRAGGSMSPEALTAIVGCDLTDPGFWSAGLDIVEGQLNAAVDAARAAGRL